MCLQDIVGDSVVTCHKIIDVVAKQYVEPSKTTPIDFNEKKATSKKEIFHILLNFLLIAISLLIAVSIYHYY